MRPEIRRLTAEQVLSLLAAVRPTLTRKITAVHLHHTWRPTRAQFRGLATIEAMRKYHLGLGWDDIAQHLTIDPVGIAWTGRNWNLPPASQKGSNGTAAAGPFMIEMVGDFDAGRD
ncbi:MAG: peptidase C14, partial [Acidobacteria bacterium]|nr:peptidase C14 [Acidobacteriota bacterium]